MLWLDGGGVFPDRELAADVRLRVRLTDQPSEDVTIYVENGRLHIAGQYTRLCVRQCEPHRISVEAVAAGGPRTSSAERSRRDGRWS